MEKGLPKITIIPVSTVIDTIMENLEKGGVIEPSEIAAKRKVVEAMDGQELIDILLQSHAIREAIRALSN